MLSFDRAKLRSDPALTQRCFDICDADGDGRLEGAEVGQLAALALSSSSSSPSADPSSDPSSAPEPPSAAPAPLTFSPSLLGHLSVMVDLPGRGTPPLSQIDLVRELKKCRDAYKQVGTRGR